MTLKIEVDISPAPEQIFSKQDRQLTEVNIDTVQDLLDEIEAAQIKAYGSNSRPGRPAGSTYVRTFRLQRSSRRFVGRITARQFNAEWRTDLNYAPFVIGRKSDQANIHRGRWKSLEQVAEEVDKKVKRIYDKNFKARIK